MSPLVAILIASAIEPSLAEPEGAGHLTVRPNRVIRTHPGSSMIGPGSHREGSGDATNWSGQPRPHAVSTRSAAAIRFAVLRVAIVGGRRADRLGGERAGCCLMFTLAISDGVLGGLLGGFGVSVMLFVIAWSVWSVRRAACPPDALNFSHVLAQSSCAVTVFEPMTVNFSLPLSAVTVFEDGFVVRLLGVRCPFQFVDVTIVPTNGRPLMVVSRSSRFTLRFGADSEGQSVRQAFILQAAPAGSE